MFILIWTRWGFLVPIYGLIAAAIVVEVGPALVADGGGKGANLMPLVTGLVVTVLAAIAVWFTGRWLNNPSKDKELHDPQTGEAVVLKNRSSFFFINMEWWAVAFPVIAAISYLT